MYGVYIYTFTLLLGDFLGNETIISTYRVFLYSITYFPTKLWIGECAVGHVVLKEKSTI